MNKLSINLTVYLYGFLATSKPHKNLICNSFLYIKAPWVYKLGQVGSTIKF